MDRELDASVCLVVLVYLLHFMINLQLQARTYLCQGVFLNELYEPPRGKTNNVVSDQVRHKPTCTVTEKSLKLEISDLRRRGSVKSV